MPPRKIDPDAVGALLRQGVPQRAIAEQFAVTQAAIWRVGQKLGIPSQRNLRPRAYETKRLHHLVRRVLEAARYEQFTLRSLEERSGVSRGTIRNWLHADGPVDIRKFSDVAEVVGYRVVLEKIDD